jgi:hypothetical protein
MMLEKQKRVLIHWPGKNSSPRIEKQAENDDFSLELPE